MPRRVLSGKVVSDKGDKTVIVRVERRVMHPLLKKYIRVSKRYTAHDEDNQYKTGDTVMIEECRPMSRRKRFLVLGMRGGQATADAGEASAGPAVAPGGEEPAVTPTAD